jgi:hypothetical protein
MEISFIGSAVFCIIAPHDFSRNSFQQDIKRAILSLCFTPFDFDIFFVDAGMVSSNRHDALSFFPGH